MDKNMASPIWINSFLHRVRFKSRSGKVSYPFLVFVGILLAIVMALILSPKRPHPNPPPKTEIAGSSAPLNVLAPTSPQTSPRPSTLTSTQRLINILVDDFIPRPYPGESIHRFNRLEGDRGALNNSIVNWGNGQVTTTISSGNSWGGVWMSLNHPIREGLPIDFSAMLPTQILPAYQSQITGITAVIVDGTPGRIFKLELKDKGDLRWKEEIVLKGGLQVVSPDLPVLGDINEFLWVLDNAYAGDYVVLESVSFTATTGMTDTATTAFVWSYGMLLNNWNPTTGLVRDKAKDASGEFDAIQATGSPTVA